MSRQPNPAPASRDPRDWARWYLRRRVERGDDLDRIFTEGYLAGAGQGRPRVDICINGDLLYQYRGADDCQRLRVRRGQIGVVLDDRITGVYGLHDIEREIKLGVAQPLLFPEA